MSLFAVKLFLFCVGESGIASGRWHGSWRYRVDGVMVTFCYARMYREVLIMCSFVSGTLGWR